MFGKGKKVLEKGNHDNRLQGEGSLDLSFNKANMVFAEARLLNYFNYKKIYSGIDRIEYRNYDNGDGDYDSIVITRLPYIKVEYSYYDAYLSGLPQVYAVDAEVHLLVTDILKGLKEQW